MPGLLVFLNSLARPSLDSSSSSAVVVFPSKGPKGSNSTEMATFGEPAELIEEDEDVVARPSMTAMLEEVADDDEA